MKLQASPRLWLRSRKSYMVLLASIIIGVSALLLQWRSVQSAKTSCQTNLRRLSTALLLYSQDHDGALPPIHYQLSDGTWRHWVTILGPYFEPRKITVCPANPADDAREPWRNYPFPHSYALNERFFGRFGPGPFPVECLELPAQTALLVEGGAYRADGPSAGPTHLWAMSWYWDTAWWPNAYASPHRQKMNVAAADGHVVNLEVAHYTPEGHDPLYGRLGKSIYNWNGGHPNGDTSGPPRE